MYKMDALNMHQKYVCSPTKPLVWGVMPCCQVTTSVGQFFGFYKTHQVWVKFFPKWKMFWLWVYEIFSKIKTPLVSELSLVL